MERSYSRCKPQPAHAGTAGRQILDLGSAAICSIGYEALLKRGFNGDFQALIGWWRRQRDEGTRN